MMHSDLIGGQRDDFVVCCCFLQQLDICLQLRRQLFGVQCFYMALEDGITAAELGNVVHLCYYLSTHFSSTIINKPDTNIFYQV